MSSGVIDRNFEAEAHGGGNQAGQARYKFSPEELRALRECNRESFYYRCIPISALLGGATFYFVKQGWLKPSVRFGATPKILIASTLGYFLGKFSYQQQCIEKLMALPNSALGEQLRRQRGRAGPVSPGLVGWGEPSFPVFDQSTDSTPAAQSDETSARFTDVGDTRPLDSFDSSVPPPADDYTIEEEIKPIIPKPNVTYDELRRANREEWYQKKLGREQEQVQQQRAQNVPPPAPASRQPERKEMVRNKYGDVWEKSD